MYKIECLTGNTRGLSTEPEGAAKASQTPTEAQPKAPAEQLTPVQLEAVRAFVAKYAAERAAEQQAVKLTLAQRKTLQMCGISTADYFSHAATLNARQGRK